MSIIEIILTVYVRLTRHFICAFEVMQIFTELNRDGKTIILVTHNPSYEKYASHRINIHDGTVTLTS